MYTNIIFFDGYCILCNGFVDFLMEIDVKEKLKFASLQGETAKRQLAPSHLHEIDTVIFLNSNHEVLTKSKAIIDILKTLGGLWKFANIFSFLPSFLLDKIYDLIAHNRYGWFGKRNSCRMPSTSEAERILP